MHRFIHHRAARRMAGRGAIVLLVAALAAVPLAQGELGSIAFPTSGAPTAQPAFIRGVLLLHSFEYDDAREAFADAQRLDPGFAMAYWGEAMTHNHPLWNQTAPDRAQAALAKLAPTPAARAARAATQKEKDWLAAVEALFGDGDKAARDRAYAAALADMYARYPGDLEVASFYALALLGTSGTTRDYAIYMRAAAVAEEVYAKNPKHPGAVHYLIHAYDDPVHAPLGLRYANIYADVAPAASHALHMPSHIYFAMGMWDQASTLNERSAKAADDRVAAKGLTREDRGYHALLWLTYSYLQQGRYAAARGILEQLETDAAKSGSIRTRSHLALARAAWLIETRRWTDAKPRVDATGLGADAVAAELFATGLAAARSGNAAAARDARARLTPLAGTALPAAGGHTDHQPAAAYPAATGGRPAGSGSRAAAIMAVQLDAILAAGDGRRDAALEAAKRAAAMEDALSFEFGPPNPVKPAHELNGELLLDFGRPAEAQQAFETGLKRTPGRALSLLGLFRAAKAAKDDTTAQRAAETLRRVWHRADGDVEGVGEIRTGLRRFLVPGSWFLVPGSGFRVPGSGVPGSWFLVPGFLVPGFLGSSVLSAPRLLGSLAPRLLASSRPPSGRAETAGSVKNGEPGEPEEPENLDLGTQEPGTRNQEPGTRNREPGTRNPEPGTGEALSQPG